MAWCFISDIVKVPACDFIHMTEALIDAEIPFRALELEKVLDFLAGDTFFTVNDYDEHSFSYIPSREYRKKYYPHIEWDEAKTLEWKQNDKQSVIERETAVTGQLQE